MRGVRLRRTVKKRILDASNEVRRAKINRHNGCVRVAVVSSDKWKSKVLDDLLITRNFLANGIFAEIVSWQDRKVDYKKYDAILIGSMWGYQKQLDDFYQWLKLIDDSEASVINPTDVIRYNCNKVEQFRLIHKAGLPMIRTSAIKVGGLANFKLPKIEFVIKPAVSGGGENTFLIRNEKDFEEKYEILEKINEDMALLIQPFVHEIADGEVGVVMIDGKIVNAVRRFPGVLAGEFHVEPVDHIPPELQKLAESAWSLYPGITYMRLDTVETETGYQIMEIEAFEPQLYYYLAKKKDQEKMLNTMRQAVMKKIREKDNPDDEVDL